MSGRDVKKTWEGLCPSIQKCAEGIMSGRDFVLHNSDSDSEVRFALYTVLMDQSWLVGSLLPTISLDYM